MARISPTQIHPDAIDLGGVSVATSARRADDPRYGTAYDTTAFAAAVPVHFHPLAPNRCLMLCSTRWHTVTTGPDTPGAFSSYTADTTPGWRDLQLPSGHSVPMMGGYGIPIRGNYGPAVLTGAVSRGNAYLFTLYSTSGGGVVSHWWYNTTLSSIGAVAEESVPTQGTVVFDRGLWLQDTHLVVFGHDTDTRYLHMARKPWGRIGVESTPRSLTGTPEDPRWEYWTGTGWSLNPEEIAPVLNADGTEIESIGPVSMAAYRDRTYMATTAEETISLTDDRVSHIWVQRAGAGWELAGTVALGSTVTGSYMGDTVRFQTQMQPVFSHPVMIDNANATGIPYVYSTRSVGDGVTSLVNTWGLWPVPRVS